MEYVLLAVAIILAAATITEKVAFWCRWRRLERQIREAKVNPYAAPGFAVSGKSAVTEHNGSTSRTDKEVSA